MRRPLVNLQPFFYGRSVNSHFKGAAHEKDKFKTLKRCLGLMKPLLFKKFRLIVAESECFAVKFAGSVLV